MSDVKIPLGQLGRVTVGAGAGAGGAQGQVKVDAPPAGQGPLDAFKGQLPLAGEAAQLTGQAEVQGPPIPAFALAGDARQIQSPAEALAKFQAAYAAAREELLDHPELPADVLGQRANEFFTEFAKVFVQTAEQPPQPPPDQAPPPPSPQKPEQAAQDRPQGERQGTQERTEQKVGPEIRQLARELADSLKSLGFQSLKNLANGKDGVENAFQLLTSEGLEKFAAQAKEQKIVVQGEFPPGATRERTEKQEIGEQPAPLDSQAAAEQAAPKEQEELRLPPEPDGAPVPGGEEEEDVRDRKPRKKNMLWSWLDTFRRRDESVRQAEEKWDRVTVAALLFLLLVVLVVVALASL